MKSPSKMHQNQVGQNLHLVKKLFKWFTEGDATRNTTYDEDSNQPTYAEIVHTKPLNGVSIRKNVSCGSFYNMKAEKCTTLIHESSAFQLFIFHI